MQREDLIHVEDALWVLAAQIGMAVYDFDFARYFTCRHPWQRPERVMAVARTGVYKDYDERYRQLVKDGVVLVHSPEEHLRASELTHWYGLLRDLTPKSVWFDGVPDVADVTAVLQWPIFVKGQRQTSRHKRALSIIEGPEAFKRAMEVFQDDLILHWQKIVCREYVRLRPVEDRSSDRIPSSFEFRTFWWRTELVGFGRYW